MFIEGRDTQISLSPRGRKTGKTGKRGRERYLAPEGRHVYSTRHVQILKAPEGRHVYRRAIGPRTALQRSAMWGCLNPDASPGIEGLAG